MSKCSYCGRENAATATACAACGMALGAQPAGQAQRVPEVTCPKCGAQDNYTEAMQLRSSFSLGAFLLGGIFAVMFRNTGKPTRVRCNQCETLFSIPTPGAKFSQLGFWLLMIPGILLLVLVIYAIIHALFTS